MKKLFITVIVVALLFCAAVSIVAIGAINRSNKTIERVDREIGYEK